MKMILLFLLIFIATSLQTFRSVSSFFCKCQLLKCSKFKVKIVLKWVDDFFLSEKWFFFFENRIWEVWLATMTNLNLFYSLHNQFHLRTLVWPVLDEFLLAFPQIYGTGRPRYLRSFYLQIWLFTNVKLV